MIYGPRNGQQSFSESSMHTTDAGPAAWERGYCDLCCLSLSKAFMLGCGHTLCDHCIVVLVDGNKSASPDTIECPFCLAISQHLTAIDSGVTLEIPASAPVACQAPNHRATGDSSVQYFCVQTGELICISCASSPLYTRRALLTITEAAEHFGNIVHDRTNTIRLAVAEIRKHVLRCRHQQDNLDLQLKEMIDSLNSRKNEIINALTEKFKVLERTLIHLAQMHKEELTREINDITQQVRTVMDTVSSSEKHVAQQDPLAFLAEAKSLVSLLSRRLKALSGCVEGRPTVHPLQLPQLGSTAGIVGAVRALDFKEQRGRGSRPGGE